VNAQVRLEADRVELARFIDATFRYADDDTHAALRTFAEGSSEVLDSVRVRLNGAGLDTLVDHAVRQATKAANARRPAVFAPPVATFVGDRARERDLANGLVLSVEADHAPGIARRNLEFVLGPPTVVVASGGQWIDPESGEIEDKLHLHWRCREPSRSEPEHVVLKRARALACAFAGADATAVSLVHPLRWAGSWHRKREPRLARIIGLRPDVEIEPSEVVELLEPLIPVKSASGRRGGPQHDSELDDDDLEALGEIIANPDREWADWNRLGMAFFAASNGSEAGFAAFERVSQRSAKYDASETRRRWEHFHRSPPHRLGPGTLIYEARQVDPEFRLPSRRADPGTPRSGQTDSGQSVGSAGPGESNGDAPLPPGFTEDALALEFSSRHAEDWRYVALWSRWLCWTGTHWQHETTLKAFDLARLACRKAAARCQNPKIAAKISSAGTVAAVERLARADRRHAATSDQWDQDLWALNTPGGAVDLRTGKLRPHDRADGMTKIATAVPQGDCPTWRQFLATVTGDDPQIQAYLARMVGYALTGVTTEHALFFLYGTGANGKSVFVNTIAAILGDYATNAPMDTFMATQGERHPTDMASLRGARLVTSIETEQGRRWAESRLKSLTGGDTISARFMRQDFFEFTPQFKLVVAGNHKPAIRTIDEAMRRRLHLIPFTVTIPPNKRDRTLPERLLAERDGILAWAVQGCLEWQQIGLQPPEAVMAATEEYFEAEDALGRWLEECCDLGPNHTGTSADLFAGWKVWAEANGEFAGSQRRFSDLMLARGFDKWRDPETDRRGFRGVALRPRPPATTEMEF
jgi:P4 family phage/plasmid primase-like protien